MKATDGSSFAISTNGCLSASTRQTVTSSAFERRHSGAERAKMVAAVKSQWLPGHYGDDGNEDEHRRRQVLDGAGSTDVSRVEPLVFYLVYLADNALALSRLQGPRASAPIICFGRNTTTLAVFLTTTRRCGASPA